MSEKVEMLENWYRRVWEEEDAGAIDELFVPDPEIRQIGMSKPIDIEEFKGFHKLLCDQLKNIDIKIDMAILNFLYCSANVVFFIKCRNNDKSFRLAQKPAPLFFPVLSLLYHQPF